MITEVIRSGAIPTDEIPFGCILINSSHSLSNRKPVTGPSHDEDEYYNQHHESKSSFLTKAAVPEHQADVDNAEEEAADGERRNGDFYQRIPVNRRISVDYIWPRAPLISSIRSGQAAPE